MEKTCFSLYPNFYSNDRHVQKILQNFHVEVGSFQDVLKTQKSLCSMDVIQKKKMPMVSSKGGSSCKVKQKFS